MDQGTVCEKCGRVHGKLVSIGKTCTPDELSALKLIQNNASCAQQALDPRNIPEGATQEQVNTFVSAALRHKANSLMLERQWWAEIMVRHGIEKGNIHVDMETGELSAEE